MFDIIIIGAGTAGMTAGIYVARAGHTALILEGKMLGGQIINSPCIENYPALKNVSGVSFTMALADQINDLGIEIKYEEVLEIKGDIGNREVVTKNSSYNCTAVIIATGAKNRPLGLENEMELIGKGVSYCATCDGAFYRDKQVAIVGGGNTALDEALFLSNLCEKVTLIHRRDNFRAEQTLVDKVLSTKNIEFIPSSVVKSLKSEETLNAVEVKNLLTEKTSVIPVSGLFISVGHMPDNQRFKNLVDLDENGYIKAKEDCKTSAKDIFCAGDCRTKEIRQLTTATSDGTISAMSAVAQIKT